MESSISSIHPKVLFIIPAHSASNIILDLDSEPHLQEGAAVPNVNDNSVGITTHNTAPNSQVTPQIKFSRKNFRLELIDFKDPAATAEEIAKNAQYSFVSHVASPRPVQINLVPTFAPSRARADAKTHHANKSSRFIIEFKFEKDWLCKNPVGFNKAPHSACFKYHLQIVYAGTTFRTRALFHISRTKQENCSEIDFDAIDSDSMGPSLAHQALTMALTPHSQEGAKVSQSGIKTTLSEKHAQIAAQLLPLLDKKFDDADRRLYLRLVYESIDKIGDYNEKSIHISEYLAKNPGHVLRNVNCLYLPNEFYNVVKWRATHKFFRDPVIYSATHVRVKVPGKFTEMGLKELTVNDLGLWVARYRISNPGLEIINNSSSSQSGANIMSGPQSGAHFMPGSLRIGTTASSEERALASRNMRLSEATIKSSAENYASEQAYISGNVKGNESIMHDESSNSNVYHEIASNTSNNNNTYDSISSITIENASTLFSQMASAAFVDLLNITYPQSTVMPHLQEGAVMPHLQEGAVMPLSSSFVTQSHFVNVTPNSIDSRATRRFCYELIDDSKISRAKDICGESKYCTINANGACFSFKLSGGHLFIKTIGNDLAIYCSANEVFRLLPIAAEKETSLIIFAKTLLKNIADQRSIIAAVNNRTNSLEITRHMPHHKGTNLSHQRGADMSHSQESANLSAMSSANADVLVGNIPHSSMFTFGRKDIDTDDRNISREVFKLTYNYVHGSSGLAAGTQNEIVYHQLAKRSAVLPINLEIKIDAPRDGIYLRNIKTDRIFHFKVSAYDDADTESESEPQDISELFGQPKRYTSEKCKFAKFD